MAISISTLSSAWTGIILAIILGFVFGAVTAILHLKLGMGKLLSGIVVSTGLYSINFRIMGAKANLYVNGNDSLWGIIKDLDTIITDAIFGAATKILLYPATNIIFIAISVCIIALLILFFRSEFGSLVRFSRPDSLVYLESMGIKTHGKIIIGMGLANMVAALAGAMTILHSGAASISLGFGVILIAVVSLVIGEQILRMVHRDLIDIWPYNFSTFCWRIYLYTHRKNNKGYKRLLPT